MIVQGIEYSKPDVYLLQDSGIGVAEVAGRTAYDSFDKSENEAVRDFGGEWLEEVDKDSFEFPVGIEALNSIESSELLHSLSWVYHHESVVEHATLSYLIQGTSRACYSSDTEVLTKNGWKLFKDTTATDLFATRNDITNNVEYQKASDFISYKYSGVMHRYKANTVDLLVTPNHRMLFKRSKADVRKNKEALHYMKSEDIKFSRVRMLKKFNSTETKGFNLEIPPLVYKRKNTDKEITKEFTYTDKVSMLKFLAAYISDGSVTFDKKEHKWTIVISTPYKNKKELILEWGKNLGLHGCMRDKNIRFNNMPLGKFLKSLGKSHQKYVPFNPLDLTKEEANIFIDTYLMFDGSINYKSKQGALYTSSKKLSDDLYNICLVAGYTPNLHIVDNVGKELKIAGYDTTCNHIAYQIGISFIGAKNVEPIVGGRGKPLYTEENYDDYVYCVTVPNSNLFVRRQNTGNAVWCGNCLQEHSRHRIQSITVRSTRYTMSKVLYAFIAAYSSYDSISPKTAKDLFFRLIKELDMFVIDDDKYLQIEVDAMYDKLFYQMFAVGQDAFYKSILAKDNLEFVKDMIDKGRLGYKDIYDTLCSNKTKRNVGDSFKHLVTDNWKVDMVVTFNLRSLKNYFDLRDSGAAYFQIQWLAQAIKEATPKKYLRLIAKEFRDA